MGKFEIVFSKKAAKDYRKLPVDYKTLIDIVINKLSLGVPVDVKQITGEENVYRIRVGKYRLLFSIENTTIIVSKIGPRGDIYK